MNRGLCLLGLSLLPFAHSAIAQDSKDSRGDPLPRHAVARLGTQLLRHHYNARSIAFSPDGKTIATIANDIKLWDVATGSAIAEITPKHAVKSIDFSADGKTIIAAGVFTQAVYLFDVETRTVRQSIGSLPWGREWVRDGDREDVRPLCMYADGKSFVAPESEEIRETNKDGRASYQLQQWAKWFDASTGAKLHQVKLEKTHYGPQFFALSADGKHFACMGHEYKILVWNRNANEPTWRLNGHKEAPLCGAFAPSDGTLVTGGMDKAIRLWDIKTGKESGQLNRHEHSVLAVSFLPNKKTLASLSRERICLWNWADKSYSSEFKLDAHRFCSMAISVDGRFLAGFTTDGTIVIWNLTTGKLLHPIEGHRSAVHAVAFSPDGATLASAAGAESVILWDFAGRKVRSTLKNTTAERLAFFPPRKGHPDRLLVAGPKRTPEIWDVSTGDSKRLQSLKGSDLTFYARLSPDGKHLAAFLRPPNNSKDDVPMMYLWDVDKGDVVRTIGKTNAKEYYRSHCAIAFSPDGKLLATGGVNLPIQVMTVADGKLVREIDNSSRGLAFSPDGKTLASESWNSATLYDVATGAIRAKFGKGGGGGIGIEHALAFSRDGRLFAFGDEQGGVHLWELSTGWKAGPFKGHRGFVYDLAFSPDGDFLVSAAEDTTIVVWGLRSGSASSLAAAWRALGDADPLVARAGVAYLVAAPEEMIAHVKATIPMLPTPERMKQLLADIGDSNFKTRAGATRELELLQEFAAPALRSALDAKQSLEVSRRLELLLARAKGQLVAGTERVRWVRVLDALERIRTAEALAVVQTLAQPGDDTAVGSAAGATLQRWETRGAK